jgi:hypothetical protein
MPPDALPYLTPSPDAVLFGPWQHRVGGSEWTELPPALEGWVPGLDLDLRRRVVVDLDGVRHEMGLPGGSPFVLTVSYEDESKSRARRCGMSTRAVGGEQFLDVRLAGEHISGTLVVNTTLSLGSAWDAPPGRAGRPGSIAAWDRVRSRLEGTAPLFPVSVCDFATTSVDVGASWHLATSPDLDAPFAGKFLLRVNERDHQLVRAVRRTGDDDRFLRALIDEMYAGVAKVMIMAAVEADREQDLLERGDWPDDSVGKVLHDLLVRCGLSPREFIGIDPGDQESVLQAAVRRSGIGRIFE